MRLRKRTTSLQITSKLNLDKYHVYFLFEGQNSSWNSMSSVFHNSDQNLPCVGLSIILRWIPIDPFLFLNLFTYPVILASTIQSNSNMSTSAHSIHSWIDCLTDCDKQFSMRLKQLLSNLLYPNFRKRGACIWKGLCDLWKVLFTKGVAYIHSIKSLRNKLLCICSWSIYRGVAYIPGF